MEVYELAGKKTARILVQNSNRYFQEDHLRFESSWLWSYTAILSNPIYRCAAWSRLGNYSSFISSSSIQKAFRRCSLQRLLPGTLTSITVFPFSVFLYDISCPIFTLFNCPGNHIQCINIYQGSIDNPTRPITDKT